MEKIYLNTIHIRDKRLLTKTHQELLRLCMTKGKKKQKHPEKCAKDTLHKNRYSNSQ